MSETENSAVENRVDVLERKQRHRIHSGIAVWATAVAVGFACGLVVLGLANNYSNQQREKATRAAAVKLNHKTLVVARAFALHQYHASIAGCKRGNKLRRNENLVGSIVREFLITARTARIAAATAVSATPAERDLNSKAAARYTVLIPQIKPIAVIDCTAAFPKP